MLQIRLILKLLTEGCGYREISRITGIHRKTIREYDLRIKETGKDYEALPGLSDAELSGLLVPPKMERLHCTRRHWLEDKMDAYLKELHRPHVTRQLLWEEYRQQQPDGYSYSQFCDHLQRHKQKTEPILHITHLAGDRYEFDFAGDPMHYFDVVENVEVSCPVLVCTLPYSGFSYIEPLASARQEHLIPALNRAVEYLGGVPRFMVTDNMAQVVIRSSRYEPAFTELTEQWSLHYNTAIKAVRVKKPKDKASVEKAVHLTYQRVYARLRDKTFYSLQELRMHVLELLEEFNDRPMQTCGMSRRERFVQQEKGLLRPLPETPFVLKNKTKAKVKKNYHVVLGQDMHSYSVPYQYVGQQTNIVYDENVVEVFLDNFQRIAIHTRDTRRYGYSTLPEHRPESHRRYLEQRGWNQDDFIKMASQIGETTGKSIDRILTSKVFVEQTYDSCIGVLQLGKKYGNDRLEAACKRANQGNRITYRIIKNILENNLDKVQLKETSLNSFIPEHTNIRGPEAYY